MGTALAPYGTPGRPKKREEDVFGEVPEAQQYLREGTLAYGQSLQPAILKEIGSTLGGLNAIGGLRSGGVPVALGEIGQKYADIIGQHAARATEEGLQYGLAAHRQRFEEAEAKRRRKAALLGAIGSVLGAGIGFAIGGPPGAAIGSQVGHVGDFGAGSGGGGGPGSPGPADTFI